MKRKSSGIKAGFFSPIGSWNAMEKNFCKCAPDDTQTNHTFLIKRELGTSMDAFPLSAIRECVPELEQLSLIHI